MADTMLSRLMSAIRRHCPIFLIAVCLIAPSCSGGGKKSPESNRARGPYLQMATPTSIVVRWRTAEINTGRVRFGSGPANLDFSVDEPAPGNNHEVELTGLAPNTKYFYDIESTTAKIAGGASYFFTTPPGVGVVKATRIWALGDAGNGSQAQKDVRDAFLAFNSGLPPDLWLMLGDNAYPDGTDADYQSNVFQVYRQIFRQSPLWPALGNHDAHATASNGAHPYFNIFTLPAQGEAGGLPSGTEHYYSFDYSNIHFICLDSEASSRSPTGPMLSWLANDLAATAQFWIVAYWHHSPYSRGSHNSDTDSRMRDMRQNALPILESAGVDLVLGGHSHAYERSSLINGHYGQANTFDNSMRIDAGSGQNPNPYEKLRQPNEGTVYVVAGSGGQLSSGPFNHPAIFTHEFLNGSLVIDVNANQMDVRFLDSAGTVDDSFTLIKTPYPDLKRFAATPSDRRKLHKKLLVTNCRPVSEHISR